MSVKKELTIIFKDGTRTSYPLGKGEYGWDVSNSSLIVTWRGKIFGVYNLKVIDGYKEEADEIMNPVDQGISDKKSYVLILLKSGESIKYEGMELKVMEATLEICGNGTTATFLLRDVSGWEVRE